MVSRQTINSGKFILILFMGLILFLVSCEEIDVHRVIKIETLGVSDIKPDSANVTGEILDLGEEEIIQHGHCWSTQDNPTIYLETKDNLGKINYRGEFASQLFALIPDTTYYVKSYATNAQGTVYGKQVSFNTIKETGTFMDNRDRQVYNWVKIGNQVWMSENLAYLPAVSPSNLESETAPFYYVYEYDGNSVIQAKATSNYGTYGVLYNWPAVMNKTASSSASPSGVQGICPNGWHVPSDMEWKQLEMRLGMSQSNAEFDGVRGTNEGGKLKESGFVHWTNPNAGADNSSSFTALPGGARYYDGFCGNISLCGFWWTATEADAKYAWYRGLYYNNSLVGHSCLNKEHGFSVRCIRD